MKLRTSLVPSSLLVLSAAAGCAESLAGPAPPASARAVLVPIGDSGVSGEVTFVRNEGSVTVRAEIEGLEPGKHGFHVHEYGDLSDGSAGESAGGHFAPMRNPHGPPGADARHVGDLGNVEAGPEGRATLEFTDDRIALSGDRSIIGRAVVVHAGEDTFGQPSGDAGGRVAFGVIGIAKPEE